MTKSWIVRLEADDGTDLDGRLEVTTDELRFMPGTRGALAPAVVVNRADIASAEVIKRGMSWRVQITLGDGHRMGFDHGFRPVDELAALLGATEPHHGSTDAR